MDKSTRRTAAVLRDMSSSQAADWLLAKHPREGDTPGVAIKLLAHLSLQKRDNLRLARHYLAGPTWAHEWPYQVFAKCLGARKLIATLDEVMSDTERDRDLLRYHLCIMRPMLRSDSELAPVQAMIDRLLAD